MTKRTVFGLALAFVVSGCDTKGLAYGDANSIIAVMAPELWENVSDDVYAALEPTIRTVRDEKTFTVTYQEPHGEFWGNMQRFRQMLVVGTRDEPIVAEVIEAARTPITEPGMHRVNNVWANGQSVTLILLSKDGAVDELMPHLAEVNQLLDQQFRRYAVNRMYMSGVDSALADTLYTEADFFVLVPDVYKWERRDSVFIFRNDQPDPAELIRQVSVTWRTPIPLDLQPEGILEWRAELVDANYSEPQNVDLTNSSAMPFDFRGRYAYEIQAKWVNPPERNWPAGGPLITRAVICENQNRMYLLDSWLYAPGKEKYEYMIQLQTILDSFRCGTT